MEDQKPYSRRVMLKSTVFGTLCISLPNFIFGKNFQTTVNSPPVVHEKYPAIEDSIVSEVVGVSHFDLDRLKLLVVRRPELARATWDWGFGDWESAIGAASHVGRTDIIHYLLSKGARPDIFTYATLGAYSIVKNIIEFSPGIQTTFGPHGISLLQHAKNGLAADKSPNKEGEKLVSYLENLGNADSPLYPKPTEEEFSKYLGEYKYGPGEKDGFTIRMNQRKFMSLGKTGRNGGALYKTGDNKFIYNGSPSVMISFRFENEKVLSLTISEPDLVLVAIKI